MIVTQDIAALLPLADLLLALHCPREGVVRGETMTAAQDIAPLCAAIDAGDDAALLQLADLLEETGDPRAAGLLEAAESGPTVIHYGPDYWFGAVALEEVFGKARMWRLVQGERRLLGAHPSRSAAYLALAQALSEAP